MSAEIPEQREELIPRVSPVIKLKMGEKAIDMTYNNTRIYLFPKLYKAMNHVFVVTDPEIPSGYFLWADQNPDLIEQLAAKDYPSTRDPFPSDKDVESYLKHQEAVLEKELSEFKGGE